jgi:hypothetical protein
MNKRRSLLAALLCMVLGALSCLLSCESALWAGALEPTAGPTDSSSAMYKLEDIYNRLDTGAAGSKSAFTGPSAAPGATGRTTDEVMGKMPVVDDASGVSADKVREGKTYFGLGSSGWGLKTGTLAERTSATALSGFTLRAGYYASGFDLQTADANLLASNIAYNVAIFGVTGNVAAIVNTAISSGGASASDILDGKIVWVNGTAVTGAIATKSNFSGTSGALSFSIPDGFYDGTRTATAADANLSAGNILSGVSIFGTSGSYTNPTGDAATTDVLSGATFSSATAGFGATGAMANNGAATYTPTTASQTIAAGYHNGSGYVAGDANLVSGNIRSGVSIFGVSGSSTVVNTTIASNVATAATIASGKTALANGATLTGALTTSLTVPARPAKTGQTTSYADGDDGMLRTGAGNVYPRFKDNGDGTVRDNLTGLIWLQNANCFGTQDWASALGSANSLASGACGLNDGSSAGDWRLPNVKELKSLSHAGNTYPALPTGHPFTNVQSYVYWSSTSYAASTTAAWYVQFTTGALWVGDKTTTTFYGWPVREGL